MDNVTYTVENNILNIRVDLTKEFGLSASGKTIAIASSRGNQKIKDNISMGLNVYKKP